MTAVHWSAGLTALGCLLEVIGVWLLADELSGPGPYGVTHWLWRKSNPIRLSYWRILAKFGYHHERSVLIFGETATATARVNGVSVVIGRPANETVEERFAALEADIKRANAQTSQLSERVSLLTEEFALFPDRIAVRIDEATKEHLDSRDRANLPIQIKSIVFILIGVVLNGVGGLVAFLAA